MVWVVVRFCFFYDDNCWLKKNFSSILEKNGDGNVEKDELIGMKLLVFVEFGSKFDVIVMKLLYFEGMILFIVE